jgi:hypothetical protein
MATHLTAELHLQWLLLRREAAAVLILAIGAAAALAWAIHGRPTSSYVDRALESYAAALVAGAYWPLALWRREPPSRRGYLAGLPVRPESAAVVRTAVGLLLLEATVVAGLLAAAAVALLSGRGAELAQTSPAVPVAYLGGVAVVYLLASVPTLLSEWPARWIAASLAAGVTLVFARDWTWVYGPPTAATSVPFGGPLGVGRALLLAMSETTIDPGLAEVRAVEWAPALGVWLALATIAALIAALWMPRMMRRSRS